MTKKWSLGVNATAHWKNEIMGIISPKNAKESFN